MIAAVTAARTTPARIAFIRNSDAGHTNSHPGLQAEWTSFLPRARQGYWFDQEAVVDLGSPPGVWMRPALPRRWHWSGWCDGSRFGRLLRVTRREAPVLLLASGTRGDVQPFLALALGLQGAGVPSVIAAAPRFRALVEGRGVGFASLRGNPSDLMAAGGGSMAASVSGGIARGAVSTARFLRAAQDEYRLMLESAAEAGRPGARDHRGPLLHLGAVDCGSPPRAMRVLHAAALRPHTRVPVRPSPRPFLPRGDVQRTDLPRTRAGDVAALAAHDERLAARAPSPAASPGGTVARDVCLRPPVPLRLQPRGGAPSPRLARPARRHRLLVPRRNARMERAPGSRELSFVRSPADLRRVRQHGDRRREQIGACHRGRSHPSRDSVPLSPRATAIHLSCSSTVHGVRSSREIVPHTWLFPRVAAVVHHGGAGTTAEGVRAGVPSVIFPGAADQYFWAERIEDLGAGPRAATSSLAPRTIASLLRPRVDRSGRCGGRRGISVRRFGPRGASHARSRPSFQSCRRR